MAAVTDVRRAAFHADRRLCRRRKHDVEGSGVPTSLRPSRSRPAPASKVASTSPASSLARRVCDIAAQAARSEGRAGATAAARRAAARRCRRLRRPSARRSNRRRSAGRARRRAAGRRRCGSRAAGSLSTSFIEWTQKSTSLLQQGAVELLGPQLLAADLRERAVLDAVAGRFDRPGSGRDRPASDWRLSSAEATLCAWASARGNHAYRESEIHQPLARPEALHRRARP